MSSYLYDATLGPGPFPQRRWHHRDMTPRSAVGRRIGGLLLIVVVLVALPMVSALRRHWIPGQGVADWPAPPPVGSCVGVPSGDETAVVPCDQPHLQEVTRVFAATDPELDRVARQWDQFCGEPVADYLTLPVEIGGADDIWAMPQPQYAYRLLRAPEKDRAADVGWLACTVRPQGGVPYSGSVRGLGMSWDRPAAFGQCGSGEGASVGYSGVSCAEPHQWQLLGVGPQVAFAVFATDRTMIDVLSSRDAESFRESCPAFAAAAMGVDDPTYGGALVVDMSVVARGTFVSAGDVTGDGGDSSSVGSESTEPGNYIVGSYECRVIAADPDAVLADSMEHWGDRQPPLTGAR